LRAIKLRFLREYQVSLIYRRMEMKRIGDWSKIIPTINFTAVLFLQQLLILHSKFAVL
jgi:hypothetical protein